ncbi:MAG: carboxypeptidase regulatory-like domain-containing protein, partial [Acidobacteriota bacterium]|nr:carboxypeptidase regulatory-like domain-containing protein [Acidobacteriota bacterium]
MSLLEIRSSDLRLCIVLLTVAEIVHAQVAPTASLLGTISDPSGSLIPNASAALVNTGTGLSRETRSGPDGAFAFRQAPVGMYRLKVTAAGFNVYERSGIILNVDSAPRVNVVLSVGPVSEQVTVTADAPMVATESGTLSQIVNQRYIENLPLNGRNAATLVRMAPGTVTGVGTTTAGYANTSETQAISVNGTRGNEVNYKLDGATHMDNVTDLNATYPNPDALAEFSVETSNFSARYGDAAGAVVSIVTKSGTNALHGSAFEFLRNGALN